MDSFEEYQELSSTLERLESICTALEEQAGLTEIMERAREGRFFKLGAFGEQTTLQEFNADEYDARREKTRDAYFSVSDDEL